MSFPVFAANFVIQNSAPFAAPKKKLPEMTFEYTTETEDQKFTVRKDSDGRQEWMIEDKDDISGN